MAKTKISAKPKASLSRRQNLKASNMNRKQKISDFYFKEDANLTEYDPVKNLLDVNKMGAAIMQCLMENDTEGVIGVIENYLYAVHKTQFLKEANLPRSTVYNFLKEETQP